MLEFVSVSKAYRVRESWFGATKYRTILAVDNVSLEVKNHETVALLGPNGAGKSTLCKMAAGMVKPTSGRVLLEGMEVTQNIRSASRKIGVVLGPSLVYYRMKGRQYLRFFARIYRVNQYESRINQLSEELGIRDFIDEHIEEYSTGMKMKISLARALLHDPSLLVLDEFTSGLDPISALHIRQLVKGVGKTILLTTHNPHEAEVMADRVSFISKGKVVAIGSPAEMVQSVREKVRLQVVLKDTSGMEALLTRLPLVSPLSSHDRTIEFSVPENDVPMALKVASDYGLTSVRIERPTLEDAYAKFAGAALHPESAEALA